MKTLLVCMYHDYGKPERGMSYEYATYYEPLKNLSDEILFFDFFGEMAKGNKKSMNNKLYELVKKERPDITFFALYKDEIEHDTLSKIREFTKTFCFFQDDTWRTDYTLEWCKDFDVFGTPDPFGVDKYKELGINNVLHVPFGSNEYINKDYKLEKIYDVSFVGVRHPFREWMIKKLEREGIKVHAFGRKWENGRVTPEEMAKIFNQSKINLNISNSISYDIRYLLSSVSAVRDFMKNNKRIEQQKARPFEVCGSAGFLLTYYVSGLENYYEIGKEVAIYSSPDEMVEQVKYYLSHEKEREQIAQNGYQKTMREHTFTKRFDEIINVFNNGRY